MSHAQSCRTSRRVAASAASPLALRSPAPAHRRRSRKHTQPKGCQLLFTVHFAPFCCSSAAPFIIHRSSYCGARYNAQLQQDDGQNTPGPTLFRVALQRYADATNGTEGERASERARECVLRLPVPLARSPARCARVGTPRVRSSKYKVNTSPPRGRLLCTRTLFYRRYITR